MKNNKTSNKKLLKSKNNAFLLEMFSKLLLYWNKHVTKH